MDSFSFGDRVECIHGGRCYFSYPVWIKRRAGFLLDQYYKSRYTISGHETSIDATGASGKVLLVSNHFEFNDRTLVLFETDDGDLVLANARGLKRI